MLPKAVGHVFYFWCMCPSLGTYLRPMEHPTSPCNVQLVTGSPHWPLYILSDLQYMLPKLIGHVSYFWCMCLSLGTYLWPMEHTSGPCNIQPVTGTPNQPLYILGDLQFILPQPLWHVFYFWRMCSSSQASLQPMEHPTCPCNIQLATGTPHWPLYLLGDVWYMLLQPVGHESYFWNMCLSLGGSFWPMEPPNWLLKYLTGQWNTHRPLYILFDPWCMLPQPVGH